MTVAELMEKLKKENPNSMIKSNDFEFGDCDILYVEPSLYEYNTVIIWH